MNSDSKTAKKFIIGLLYFVIGFLLAAYVMLEYDLVREALK